MVEHARASDDRGLWPLLSRVVVGTPKRIANDIFVPLLLQDAASVASGPDADLLEEGLASKTTSLREVNEAGDVNRVWLRHAGARALLLVDGEQILGAKQNRVVNASFLVAPGSEVELPVSCVERGRWRADDGYEFRSATTTLTSVARGRKLRRVTNSIITGGGYDAQQGAVWRDVDEYLEKSRIISKTASLQDGISARERDTRAELAELAPQARQVGIALVRDGRLVVMDMFGSVSLYTRGYRKIAGGMLADREQGDQPKGSRRVAARIVDDALRTLAAAPSVSHPAPGCGLSLHGHVDGLTFGAVRYEGAVYHAVVSAA